MRQPLKLLKCAASDAKGRAGLVFEVHPEPKKPVVVLLEVGQVVNSDPGTFKLAVEAPPRPGNDELAGATVVAPAPAKAAGTTVGATSDEGDPGAWPGRACGTASRR